VQVARLLGAAGIPLSAKAYPAASIGASLDASEHTKHCTVSRRNELRLTGPQCPELARADISPLDGNSGFDPKQTSDAIRRARITRYWRGG